MNDIRTKARLLRKNMTRQERKLWNLLRNKQFYGYRFLRQYIIDNYIVDFICVSKKIIIEVDGGQHNEVKISQYDSKRTDYLSAKEYTVIRFWNNEIDTNLDGVYEKLMQVFEIKKSK